MIQSGVVVGCGGFGFVPRQKSDKNEDGDLAIPHPAGVEIEDDVFVGANSVIAAGVLHPTLIGRSCKLDSHVQIAHNVELGAGAYLASQSGIAGSTIIGPGLRMGGAASIDGHLELGANLQIAACSGVTRNFSDDSVVAGFPARPIREWRRREAWLRKNADTAE